MCSRTAKLRPMLSISTSTGQLPRRPENRGRVLLPFLGDLFGEVLEKGELRLGMEGGALPCAVP